MGTGNLSAPSDLDGSPAMPVARSMACLSLLSVAVSVAWEPVARAADEAPLVLEAQRSGAGALSFSPDGLRLVSGGAYKDNSYLWDLPAGRPFAVLRGCGDVVKTAAFSPSGRLVVSAGLDSDHSRWVIATWDARTARKLGELPPNSGWAAAISPDGRTLAVARLARKLGFYSLPELQETAEVELGLPEGPEQVAYSPDGSTLAAWVGSSIWVGEARTGRPMRVVGVEDPIKSLAFTRDPKLVVIGFKSGVVAGWNLATGGMEWTSPSHALKEVRGMAVSPDGSIAASGGQDGSVTLWDLKTHEVIRDLDAKQGGVESVAFSRDGTRLAVGHGSTLAVWTLAAQAKRANPNAATRPKSAPRPKDTQRLGRHTYALINDPATWHLAQRRCEAMGGHLATFETPAEREFLLKLVRAADTSAWFGASDEEEEGKWVWVTGEPVTKEQEAGWGHDNHEDAQHSLCYWKNTGLFDDNFSGTRMPFVCEWND
jgi:hypothetical protein